MSVRSVVQNLLLLPRSGGLRWFTVVGVVGSSSGRESASARPPTPTPTRSGRFAIVDGCLQSLTVVCDGLANHRQRRAAPSTTANNRQRRAAPSPYRRSAVISSSSLFTICCTSACVGGSLTASPSKATPLLWLLVPAMAALSAAFVTSPGGPCGPSGPGGPGGPSFPCGPCGPPGCPSIPGRP